MPLLNRKQTAFTATFTSIFGLFVWACSDSGGTSTSSSGGSGEDAATNLDTGKTGDSSGGACAAPKTACTGDCVDTMSNDDNCGACGKKCASGEMCASGKCVTDCPALSTKCSVGGKDACVVTASDNQNCGACGKKCDSGYVCSAGKCDLTCTAGYNACSGAKPPGDAGTDAAPAQDAGTVAPYCAKLSDDLLNCGTCGNRCDFGKTCTGGLCCNQGQLACGGVCSTVSDDAKNCGTCGNVCPAATPYCSSSKCVDRYVRVGVQTNVPVATATSGWTECYKEGYEANSSIAALLASCSKSKLMMACRQTGSPTFNVLAQAPRADVFFDTGSGSNSTHTANGVAWYFNDDWSFGFAPAGAVVNRNSCDVEDLNGNEPNYATRMCVHTGGGQTSDGWRCGGNAGVNNGWERIIYQGD